MAPYGLDIREDSRPLTGVRVIRCLVADDHPVMRSGLVSVLTAEDDIEVVGQASDGLEALGLAERRLPDVAVLDLRMPRMDGLEFARQLRARGSETQVVIFTASEDLDLLELGLQAGVQGFVLKTGLNADIVRAVRAVAAGQPYIDPALTSTLLDQRGVEEKRLLSEREREVLQLLADGCTTELAAGKLFLSPTTVRSYAESGMRKLAARNRTHAVAEALRLKLIG